MTRSVPSLVGRQAELDAIAVTLRAAHAGRGTALALLGAPGSGTSRLAAEAESAALAAGLLVGRGRTSATATGGTYRPIAEVLLSIRRRRPGEDMTELGPYRAVLGHLVPEWRAPQADLPEISAVLIAEGLLRLAAYAGAGRGCLLVLEDLEGADRETLAVVEYLLDHIADAPVSLLITLRGADSPVARLVRDARRRGKAMLCVLDRLTDDEVVELAAAHLDTSPDGVPEAVRDVVRRVADGSPLLVEELIWHLLDQRLLNRTSVPAGGWSVVGSPEQAVAGGLTHLVSQQLLGLEPEVRELLETAAVIGDSFPLTAVQAVHGLTDQQTLIRLGTAPGLVQPDAANPDWYQFRHPAFAGMVRGTLTHAAQARRAAGAAEAVKRSAALLGPTAPELLASLLERAGCPEPAAAALLAAGRQLLAAGSTAAATSRLERAYRLVAGTDSDTCLAVAEALIEALTEAGRLDRGAEVAAVLDTRTGGAAAPVRIRTALRLAWAAHLTGRWEEGVEYCRRAQLLLATATTCEDPDIGAGGYYTAMSDVVAAYLNLDSPVARDAAAAERLARRVVAIAERRPGEARMAVLACRAWYALGIVVRERDLAASDASFERARALADERRLVTWRLFAMVGLAGNAWLRDGSTTPIKQARDAADEVGDRVLTLSCAATLALDLALRGGHDAAERLVADVLRETTQLKINGVACYLAMVQVVIAAHRGRRGEMQRAMRDVLRHGTAYPHEYVLAQGLGAVIDALLHEDRAGALGLLAGIERDSRAARVGFFLAGDSGLLVLLQAVDGGPDVTLTSVDELLASSRGEMRWNRHLLLWARAVLLGRNADRAGATAAAATASEAGGPFPLALHLAHRLVAGDAHAQHWGAPHEWLREAEAYFQQRGLSPVASACRALMRDLGVTVSRRSVGIERVPGALRQLGVTIREYEVLELLQARMSNREIATRLSISPRTVEKHVASSLLKLGLSDRLSVADRQWWQSITSGDARSASLDVVDG